MFAEACLWLVRIMVYHVLAISVQLDYWRTGRVPHATTRLTLEDTIVQVVEGRQRVLFLA